MRNAYRVENYKLMIDSLPTTTRSATKLEKKLYNINDAAADPQSAALLLVCAYNLDETISFLSGLVSSVWSCWTRSSTLCWDPRARYRVPEWLYRYLISFRL